jgi:hypothetical protein
VANLIGILGTEAVKVRLKSSPLISASRNSTSLPGGASVNLREPLAVSHTHALSPASTTATIATAITERILKDLIILKILQWINGPKKCVLSGFVLSV